MRRIRILPRAERDLDEIAAFIAQENLDAALGLYETAQAEFDRLAVMPEIGASRPSMHPRLADLRMWPLPRFNKVLVFYESAESEVRIVRVLHSARDIPELFNT
ncbi:MAG TPA: type II toxin-antitoxin system RelE/ParE family toxin [Candidatus Krumholzibacteria bacterium]|nr:type II toxin-antitoxin system RelE/ParE family toxin [Candidatus Krumholzibacteria bacterium]HRX51513.1 type II toxin-antitoxin system RelE/ParE family toxin [Candidatus Krumholzibacteria bacterium]